MKNSAPAAQGEQELNLDRCKSKFSTKPTKLITDRNGKKTLKQIARRWAARGYYSTPSEAMKVLMEGCHE